MAVETRLMNKVRLVCGITLSVDHLCHLAPFQRYFRFSADNSDPTLIPPEFCKQQTAMRGRKPCYTNTFQFGRVRSQKGFPNNNNAAYLYFVHC